ncbi:MAG: EAL domain-containing protein [Pseudomonadales bacterium]|nr:EAL domain-containing protein [Pseudomonadales bacterium]
MHRKRVLYVEDDIIQATMVKRSLEEQDYMVYHVTNGFEALESIKASQFDAVLTDHYMPNMSGIELLRELIDSGSDSPVVIMTAANDVSLAFSALRGGAADFISKDEDANYLSIIAPVLNRAIEKNELSLKAQRLAQQLESEKVLSFKTLDSLTQGVLILDEKLTIKYCNSYFAQLLDLENHEQVRGYDLRWFISCMLTKGKLNGLSELKSAQTLLLSFLENPEEPLKLTIEASVFEVRATPLEGTGYALTFADISHQVAQLDAMDRVINLAPVAMIAVDEEGKIVLINQKARELLAIDKIDSEGISINRFVPFEYRHGHQKLIQNYFNNLAPRRMREGFDLELLNNKGKVIPVEIALSGLEMYGKQRVLATVVDISHRKEAERVMRQAHLLTQSIIENSPFSMIATDESGKIIAISPALEAMLWYQRDELIHQQNATIFHDASELENQAVLLSGELSEDIKPGFRVLSEKARLGVVESCEWTYIRKDGSKLPVNLTVTTLRSTDNVITGYLLVAYDITEQKRANEYIEHIAHHDGLTGLPNRVLMQDRLETSLKRGRRQKSSLGVMVLDLDRFKRINDSLGHLAGDQLLKTVAERLVSVVRESDTVSRMGGDEFVLLLQDISCIEDIQIISEKILEKIPKPISVGLNSLIVTPSMGVSLFPEHGQTSEELLKNADIAMYHAKQKGRNGFQIFSPHLAIDKIENLAIEQALHEAFKKNKLEIHYQPQLDVVSGRVEAVEALVRWQDEQRGWISPAQFIPMAETTGFITTLGEWVLRQACIAINKLRSKHNLTLRLAVNVSPRQFEHPNFVEMVSSALNESGLPANALELEITEGLLVSESSIVSNKLNTLSKLGLKLAVDDFGTGYSNLSYVAKYPINTLKIDRSFMDIEQKQNLAIVGAITAIAQGLQMEVVAEGVETPAQLKLVKEKGCQTVQGFFYSPAVPCDNLITTINEIHHRTSNSASYKSR